VTLPEPPAGYEGSARGEAAIEHGPIEHGPIEHGPIEHGPIEHGPIGQGEGTKWRQEPTYRSWVPPVIELKAARAGYGRIEVIHGVDLELRAGQVLALLGPNGAGKSTLLKVVSGRIPLMSGCLHVLGRHVNGLAPDVLARAGICTIPEGRGVFPNLTVAENLRMMTYFGCSKQEVEERAFSRFKRLGERRGQLAGTLSGGEQQMLAMARTLASEPAALLADEISMGLAPLVVDELYELIADIAAEGIAVLLTEQFARAALKVATEVAIMSQGRIVARCAPSDMPKDLAKAYLGGADGASGLSPRVA
jgi:branched-chain amino acid transport system ATP-binding protein